jgi:hypothetical protein
MAHLRLRSTLTSWSRILSIALISLPVFAVINPDRELAVFGKDHLFNKLQLTFPVALVVSVLLIAKNSWRRGVWLVAAMVAVNIIVLWRASSSFLQITVWLFFLAYASFKAEMRKLSAGEIERLVAVNIATVFAAQLIVFGGGILFGLQLGSLLSEDVIVYNYLQYFSISVALCFAAYLGGGKARSVPAFALLLVGVAGAIHSQNTTALVLIIALFIMRYVVDVRRIDASGRKLLILLFAALPVVVPFATIAAVDLLGLGQHEIETALNGRVVIWREYWDAISFENVLFPMLLDEIPVSTGTHNLFLGYSVSLNPVFAAVMYMSLLGIILKISDMRARLFVLMVVCVAGINLELVTHPFFCLQLAFLCAAMQLSPQNAPASLFGRPFEAGLGRGG